MNDFTLEKFRQAAEIVKKVTLPTKLMYSEYLSRQTGGEIYLKPENMQYTGAYKVRGAYYKISTLTSEERERGLITASAGNHAQGVAYAAQRYGCKAVIVMPTVTPLIKVNRTKSYGAEVILHGDVFDDSYAYAVQLAEEKGYTLVHPFDDYDVATGQGSIAMEILQEQPDIDCIIAPVGGGGLIAGIATLAKMISPRTEVIGVEPKEAPSLTKALEAGHPVTLDSANTIADGTAVKRVGEHVFPYVRDNVDKVVAVEDDDLVVAFLDMVENHKLIVENSGLLPVAALKQLDLKGKKTALVLSGGNMDIITMSSIVMHGLIMRDRIFAVAVTLPDIPGQLVRTASIVAAEQGNVISTEHNQFVNINRNAGVELRLTLETFGTEHKHRIMAALEREGLCPVEVEPKLY